MVVKRMKTGSVCLPCRQSGFLLRSGPINHRRSLPKLDPSFIYERGIMFLGYFP